MQCKKRKISSKTQRRHGSHKIGHKQCLKAIGQKKQKHFMQSLQRNTTDQMEFMMKQSSDMILQSVSVQLQGMNTTIKK